MGIISIQQAHVAMRGLQERKPTPKANSKIKAKPKASAKPKARAKPRKYTLNGVTKSHAEWSRSLGIASINLTRRLDSGWPLEKALTTPSTGRGRTPEAML